VKIQTIQVQMRQIHKWLFAKVSRRPKTIPKKVFKYLLRRF